MHYLGQTVVNDDLNTILQRIWRNFACPIFLFCFLAQPSKKAFENYVFVDLFGQKKPKVKNTRFLIRHEYFVPNKVPIVQDNPIKVQYLKQKLIFIYRAGSVFESSKNKNVISLTTYFFSKNCGMKTRPVKR